MAKWHRDAGQGKVLTHIKLEITIQVILNLAKNMDLGR
jgi:hypothetical protein